MALKDSKSSNSWGSSGMGKILIHSSQVSTRLSSFLVKVYSLGFSRIPTRHKASGLLALPMDRHMLSWQRVLARVTQMFSLGCTINHVSTTGVLMDIQKTRIVRRTSLAWVWPAILVVG